MQRLEFATGSAGPRRAQRQTHAVAGPWPVQRRHYSGLGQYREKTHRLLPSSQGQGLPPRLHDVGTAGGHMQVRIACRFMFSMRSVGWAAVRSADTRRRWGVRFELQGLSTQGASSKNKSRRMRATTTSRCLGEPVAGAAAIATGQPNLGQTRRA